MLKPLIALRRPRTAALALSCTDSLGGAASLHP
jgi:hypothetical protein